MAQLNTYPRHKIEIVNGVVYAFLGDTVDHPQANIGLIETREGVIFVDSNTRNGEDFVNEMKDAEKPIRYLIHTHSHWDHVTANSLFAKAGATIVAAETCRKNMQEFGQSRYAASMKLRTPDRPLVPVVFPEVTFNENLTIHLGGVEVQLLFLGPAHTNDSIVVYLPQYEAVFAGDIMNYLNHCVIKQYSYPDLINWPFVLDRLYQLPIKFAVPGHGPLTDKEGIRIFRDYLITFRRRVEDLMKKGKTLEEMQKTVDLSEYSSWRHQGHIPENVEGMYISLGGRV